MHQVSDTAFRINPYTRWVHEHPERLLAEPTPVDLRACLATRAWQRTHLELGCGSGHFLMKLAQATPLDVFVGMEIRFKRLVKAAIKFEKMGLTNIWLIREWAECLQEYFVPESLDTVHINFPDPWPKRGQWKKRMVNSQLMESIHQVLKPGGHFHLKTDHSGYFLHSLHVMIGLSWAKIRFFSNDLHRNAPPGPRWESEFEWLFKSRQKAVFYVWIEKVG